MEETEFVKKLISKNLMHPNSDVVGSFMTYASRGELVKEFAWAIPTMDCLKFLRHFGPFFEAGAGTGYWAYEMQKLGIDIIPTDVDPIKKSGYIMKQDNWVNVEALDAVAAVQKYSSNRTLFMCWPSYDGKWSGEALFEYTCLSKTGKYFVYVGESHGGCTGDEMFHEILHEEWVEKHVIEIPQWCGINDCMKIYRRKWI